jgi:hypothetical protein
VVIRLEFFSDKNIIFIQPITVGGERGNMIAAAAAEVAIFKKKKKSPLQHLSSINKNEASNERQNLIIFFVLFYLNLDDLYFSIQILIKL